jgi:phage shock protein A
VGIIDRLTNLLRANVNELLDQAEDPEQVLDQVLRDMQANMVQARSQVASMIAQEKELEADLNENRHLAIEWGRKAERAVAAGNDDLAREALRRKRDTEENAGVYAEQVKAQTATVDKLKDQLRQLESKYQTTLSQRETMIARQRRAAAQTHLAQSVSAFSPLDASADLERMERRIRSAEATAAAQVEMGETGYDQQFRALEVDHLIEDELTQLKRLAGRPAPELPARATSRSTSDG